MKNHAKKFLSVILALLMLISTIPFYALADEIIFDEEEWKEASDEIEIIASGKCGDNLNWTLDVNGLLTTSGSGEMYNFSDDTDVPWYAYREVIKRVRLGGTDNIGDYAFYGCSQLEVEEFDSYNWEKIGKYAFFGCTSLKRVYIPSSLKLIDEYCFANSGIEEINYTYDNCLETIGENAFSGCQFDVFVIPENVKKISENAFSGCSNLSVVAFPESIMVIAEDAFSSTKLSDIYYTGTENQWNGITIEDNVVKNLSPVLNIDDIGYLGKHMIWLLNKTTLDIIGFGDMKNFSEEITYGESYFVEKWAKAKSIITEINFPELITSIGDYAFYNASNFVELDIPDGVTKIGKSAFYKSSNLKQVNLPDSITEIGGSAFAECSKLEKINMPNGITEIKGTVFYGCSSLKDITLYNNIKSIGAGAFFMAANFNDIYYYGTEDEWNLIEISPFYNDQFINATVHFINCEHENVEQIPDVPPTCTENGLSAGEKCTLCGKIIKEQTITSEATGHSHTSEITTPATHLAEGVVTYTCGCGDTYTESVAKLPDHTYNTVVTAPTCTAEGYTTYSCECGDAYVADYVEASGHSHTSEITTPATHLAEGVVTYTCGCGDTYTEAVAKLPDHTYNTVVTAPTCTQQGYTTYTCACGDSYVSDYMDVVDHKDADGDYLCDFCDKDLDHEEDEGNTNNCSHICHKTGFLGFFAKIAIFFWRLFGINPVCECGAAHY